jgi:hypothetical protein
VLQLEDSMIIQNEATVTEAVRASMAATTPNQRLREVMDSLVRHLHAFVRETRPTEEEWDKGLAFVTGLGQLTNDSHNETILAADILGLSTLVGMQNNPTWASVCSKKTSAPKNARRLSACWRRSKRPCTCLTRV